MKSRTDSFRTPRLIIQEMSADCGISVIRMVCDAWLIPLDVVALRRRFSASRGGMNLLDILGMLRELGFEASASRPAIDALLALNGLAIAHWDGCHVVLLHGDGRKVVVNDPGKGRQVASSEVLEKHFSGTVLHVKRASPGSAPPLGSPLETFIAECRPYLHPGLVATSLVWSILTFAWFRLLLRAEVNPTHGEILLVASVLASIGILAAIRDRWVQTLEQKMSRAKGDAFYPKLISTPNLRDAAVSGRLTSVFSDDLQLARLQPRLVPSAAGEVLASVLLVVALLAISPPSALAVATVSAVCLAGWRKAWGANQDARLLTKSARRDFFLFTEQLIEFARESRRDAADRLQGKWRSQFDELRSMETKGRVVEQRQDRWLSVMPFAVPVSAVCALHFSGHPSAGMTATIALLGAIFAARLCTLLRSLDALSQYIPEQHSQASIAPHVPHSRLDSSSGVAIRAVDLGFAYDSCRQILSGLRFELNRGEVVALRGESGSGKTTLLSLLSGENSPLSGSVATSGAVGLASIDAKLFSASIIDNVTLFERDADPEWIKQVFDICRLTEVCADLPMGMHTYVGADGMLFSLGQRQRILLARAIHARPSILLIDECLSALPAGMAESILRDLITHVDGIVVCGHAFFETASFARVLTLRDGRLVREKEPELEVP